MDDNSLENKNKYAYMIVDKSKRFFLGVVVLIFFFIFTMLIFENEVHSRHWGTVALPICLMGLLFIFIPNINKWIYEPWQSRNRQYERHFND
ncbi:MAG: hypothetical protein R3B45_01880 [Bdellovibrionota bacterium]